MSRSTGDVAGGRRAPAPAVWPALPPWRPAAVDRLGHDGGVITALSRRYTKRGELMATFVLEDLDATIEVMVFPKTMTEYGCLLEQDAVVVVRGRVGQPRRAAQAGRDGDSASRARGAHAGGAPSRSRFRSTA